MRLNRILLSVLLVLVALMVQVSVLARLQLPGAVPDLLLLVVLGLALVYGHVGGALVGFGAGLLADLAPPADHAAGRYALVLCVIGYCAGLAKPEKGQVRSATRPMLVVVGAAVLSTVLYAGVGSLVGDTGAPAGLGKLMLTAMIYDLLLAPFTVPLVMALARRVDRDPLAESASGGSGATETGWLAGMGPSRGGRFGLTGRGGGIGGQRGGLLTKPVRRGAPITKPVRSRTRIKGVKRL